MYVPPRKRPKIIPGLPEGPGNLLAAVPDDLAPRLPSSLAIVLRDIGSLLVLIAGLMLVPVVVALGYWEPYAGAAFVASALITAAVGGLLRWVFRSAHEPKLRHALVTAGGGWLAVAFVGALPFFLAAQWTPEAVMASYVPTGAGYASSLLAFQDPVHAIFESMSAYTTTGLTMTVHEPSLSRSMLFYRSFAQWIGGAGVLVLALAILRQTVGVGGYSLYRSEARQERVRPSIVSTARSIAVIYLGITLLVAAYLAACLFLLLPNYGVEPTLFDAVNHAMTGQATGGFSTLDDSIAGYGSYAVELVHVPPMILGAIALPVYYAAFADRDPRALTRDPQVRTLVTLLVLGVPTMALLLARGVLPMPSLSGDLWASIQAVAQSQAVREGLFQYVSALSGTGWQTAAVGTWTPAAGLFLVLFAMNLGGCAGATTGGIKLIRVLLVAKGLRWQITSAFLPENAIQTLQVGPKQLSLDQINEELRGAGMLVIAYLLILAVATILVAVLLPGHAFRQVIFEVASAQGTVGLSTGITGPGMDRLTEVLFVFLMWVGRLEIFPVLALIRALRHGLKFR